MKMETAQWFVAGVLIGLIVLIVSRFLGWDLRKISLCIVGGGIGILLLLIIGDWRLT